MDSGPVARAGIFIAGVVVNHPAIVPLEINSTEITEMFTAGICEKGNWKHPKCCQLRKCSAIRGRNVLYYEDDTYMI